MSEKVKKIVQKLEDANWSVISDPTGSEELPALVICCTPTGKFCGIVIVEKPPVTDEQVLQLACSVVVNKGLWLVYDGSARSEKKLNSLISSQGKSVIQRLFNRN